MAVCSELDAGDSYTYSPPPQAQLSLQMQWRFKRRWSRGAIQGLELEIDLSTPAGLAPDRQGASTDRVINSGTMSLELRADEPELHAQLDWVNRARDQRTRLLLALPPDETHTGADSALAWIEREITTAQIPAQPSAREMPVSVMPSLSAMAAGPWAIGHRALQEFEVMACEGRRWLGLTLVRSVGWLSRRDLRTRGQGAGPDIATPNAQCLGHSSDVFVLRAFAADTAAHTAAHTAARAAARTTARTTARKAALAAAENLRRPPVVLRGHPSPETLADPVDIGAASAQVSAVRHHRGALELRLWNPHGEALALDLDRATWHAVRADGQALAETIDDRTVDSPQEPGPAHHRLPPHGVLTLRRERR